MILWFFVQNMLKISVLLVVKQIFDAASNLFVK